MSVRFRATALIIWVLLSLLGGFSSADLNSRLTTSIDVPGSGSQRAEEILNKNFHEKSEGLITIMDKFGTLSKAEIELRKDKTVAALRVVPNSRVVQQQALAGTLFTVVSTNSTLTETSKFIEPLRSELATRGLNRALVSGPPAIYNDVKPVLASDLRRGEVIALSLSLLLLILALGFSWAVAIPLIFAIAVVSSVLGAVNILADHFTMVLYIPNIVELIGFGLSVDFSLLAVHRYREEMRMNPSASREVLIASTMRTAGRTILISSSTVALALTTLLFFPIPFIQSLGVAGVLVPVAAALISLTLLPALLYLFGGSGHREGKFQGLLSRSSTQSKFLAKLSTVLLTKPKRIFLSTAILLAALAAPIFTLQVTPSSLTALPSSLESSKALSYLTSRVGDGIITPIAVIIDLKNENQAALASNSQARIALAARISKNPDVLSVAQGELAPYVDSTGRFYRIFIFGNEDVGSQSMQNLVQKVRSEYLPQANFNNDVVFYVGGAPAQGVDLLEKIKKTAPIIFTFAILIIGLLLGRAFKSIFIPVKAILLDLISISVALGLLVIFFAHGAGSALFGTYELPQIEVWVLLFLAVILFGISMDYEVFIVSRIRESWIAGATNETAVIDGFARTIRVVTTAAAIFIAAVSGFIGGHFAGLQELGLGLVFAVLIDATLIRLLLLPSAMILLGRANWWLPNRKSRHLER
ncbi:COG2409 Predicted drug exporters of the RND superfamily [Candidatus Nanopelagicaceae bacterium]